MSAISKPIHLAFLGCGFITRKHSGHLRKMRGEVVCSYASRDAGRAGEITGLAMTLGGVLGAALCVVVWPLAEEAASLLGAVPAGSRVELKFNLGGALLVATNAGTGDGTLVFTFGEDAITSIGGEGSFSSGECQFAIDFEDITLDVRALLANFDIYRPRPPLGTR